MQVEGGFVIMYLALFPFYRDHRTKIPVLYTETLDDNVVDKLILQQFIESRGYPLLRGK